MFDFSGSGPEVFGNLNAPRAITLSALIYCLRCLVGRDIPLNQVRGAVLCAGTAAPSQARVTLSDRERSAQGRLDLREQVVYLPPHTPPHPPSLLTAALCPQGCLAPVRVVIPKGSILDPSPDAAVVGGNVLTSQRVVDVILGAFGACAASQVRWAQGTLCAARGGEGLRAAGRGCTRSQRSDPLPLPGLHEQRDLGQRPHGLLRDGGGRCGRGTGLARAQRRAQPHDQHAHHRPRDPGEQVTAGGGGRGGRGWAARGRSRLG